MTTDWTTPSIPEIRRRFADDRLRAADLLERTRARADEVKELNIFIAPPADDIASQAAGDGPLSGIAVAVKDNICTADYPTTAASRILDGYQPPGDATAVERLRDAGAVIFGKTNLDEFAMGASTQHSHFGPTDHPEVSGVVPGGSSGGSAACVAAGICPAALGSDTGGSVRQPASFCGVVGFKPTYGRVSRRGLIAFASSLDQIGWLTKTVDGAGLLFSVVAGDDRGDSTCVGRPVPAVDADSAPPGCRDSLCVGIPRAWLDATDVDAAIRRRFDAFCRRLRDRGATITEIELPNADVAIPTYQVIATAEAASNLARYDGIRYGRRADADNLDDVYNNSRTTGFGREVKRRILLGNYTLSAGHYEQYFDRACRVRQLIIDDFQRVFGGDIDVIATPTTPHTAFEQTDTTGALDAYADDIFTVPASLAGLPAISLPVGRDDSGLPIGLQLVANRFREPTLFSAARTVEAIDVNSIDTATSS